MTPSSLITIQGREITRTFYEIVDQMLQFLTPSLECFLKTTPRPSLIPLIPFRDRLSGVPNAPRPPSPVAQVQPPPGYTNIDKIEMRINSNVERMINANMERMMRIMT